MNEDRTIKIVITITFLIVAFSFFLLYFFFRVYAPSGSDGPHSFTRSHLLHYGEDGSRLPGTLYLPSTKPTALAIIHSEAQLDRYWSSRGARFHTGRILAEHLTSRAVAVYIYDQRGSGESLVSGRNHPDLDNLSEDLQAIERQLRGDEQLATLPLYLIGHGQGCIIALKAIRDHGLVPERTLLLSCAYSGNLLSHWRRNFLKNMRLSGSPPDVIATAEELLMAWESRRQRGQSGLPDNMREAEVGAVEHRDLDATRHAIARMDSGEMSKWTEQAAALDFYKLLDAAIEKIEAIGESSRIYQLVGLFDEEIDERELELGREAMIAYHAALPAERQQIYDYEFIPDADHFLKLSHSRATSAVTLTLSRLNPFRALSQDALLLIRSELGLE